MQSIILAATFSLVHEPDKSIDSIHWIRTTSWVNKMQKAMNIG